MAGQVPLLGREDNGLGQDPFEKRPGQRRRPGGTDTSRGDTDVRGSRARGMIGSLGLGLDRLEREWR